MSSDSLWLISLLPSIMIGGLIGVGALYLLPLRIHRLLYRIRWLLLPILAVSMTFAFAWVHSVSETHSFKQGTLYYVVLISTFVLSAPLFIKPEMLDQSTLNKD